MPLREMNREQMWLLPPTLDEMVPKEHPARFVTGFLDGLGREDWADLGVEPEGGPAGSTGLPSPRLIERVAVRLYDQRALLPQAGGSLPGPDTVPVADWLAQSRSQNPVAVLPGAPPDDEGSVQTDIWPLRGRRRPGNIVVPNPLKTGWRQIAPGLFSSVPFSCRNPSPRLSRGALGWTTHHKNRRSLR